MDIFITILFIISMGFAVHSKLGLFINQYYNAKRILIFEGQKIRGFKNDFLLIVKAITLICVSLIAIFNIPCAIILAFSLLFILSLKEVKLKVKYTRRSIVLLAMCGLLIIALGILALFVNDFIKVMMFLPVFILPNLVIIIANYILVPYEKSVRAYYIKKAQKKIRLNSKLKIIAITGSYGKTSMKRYLFTLLSKKYLTIRSPFSVNTVMGLCKFINEELSPYDEYLILEFGVDSKRGMDKLLKFIKPNYGIVTAIGPMHLATFKTLANIRAEKLKIANGLIKEKVFFYNHDSFELKNEEINAHQIIPYSLNEIVIKDISIKGTNVTLTDGKDYLIPLLGNHQILNCWGAIRVAQHIGMTFEEITRALPFISPEEHRLSVEFKNDRVIIDDSYNSNKEGIEEAISVCKKLKGVKAIITPGIIEMGPDGKQINYEIGHKLIGFDFIYIVASGKNSPLVRGYLDAGGDKTKINIVSTFIEGYAQSREQDIDILLISNDAHKIHIK